MRVRGDRGPTAAAAVRPRWGAGLLGAVVAVVALVTAGFLAYEASVRFRVDTAVPASTVGEPGCVTAAEFVAPDGGRHLVDLRRYRANCVDRQLGEQTTVYYAVGDPALNSRTRQWWWPALLALPVLVLAYLGGRTVLRAARGVPASHPARTSPPPRRRPDVPVESPASTTTSVPSAQLYRVDDQAHLVYDYALQRIDVLREDVRAELALPTEARTSTLHDAGLVAVEARLGAVHRALLAGAVPEVEEQFAVIARLVGDEWRADSPLAERLLAFRRTMLRG